MAIKQHTVPQTYLKRFCGANGKLVTFDKVLGKTYEVSLRDASQERYFYDVADDGEEQSVEKAFWPLEADFSQTVEPFLRLKGRSRLGYGQREKMARFAVVQFVRTIEARRMMVDLATAALEVKKRDVIRTHFPNLKADKYRVELDNDSLAEYHAAALLDPSLINELSEILLQHIWTVGIAEAPLYTSDNPVVRHSHKRPRRCGSYGFACEGIEIAFPLSPDRILIARERKHFHSERRLDGRAVPISAARTEFYNTLQVINSSRQMYSPSGDTSLAETVCRRLSPRSPGSRYETLIDDETYHFRYRPPKLKSETAAEAEESH